MTATRLTPKQRVLKRYPDARCLRSFAMYYVTGPYCAVTWRCASAARAWREAWREIRSMTRRECEAWYTGVRLEGPPDSGALAP